MFNWFYSLSRFCGDVCDFSTQCAPLMHISLHYFAICICIIRTQARGDSNAQGRDDASQGDGRGGRRRCDHREALRHQSAGEAAGVPRQGGLQHEEHETGVEVQSPSQLLGRIRGRQVLRKGRRLLTYSRTVLLTHWIVIE